MPIFARLWLNVAIVVEQNSRMETGSSRPGGRFMFARYLDDALWQAEVKEALRIALLNLDWSLPRQARWKSCWARAGRG